MRGLCQMSAQKTLIVHLQTAQLGARRFVDLEEHGDEQVALGRRLRVVDDVLVQKPR